MNEQNSFLKTAYLRKSLDNSPAFFTGCSQSIKINPNDISCATCGIHLSKMIIKYNQNKQELLNICDNCYILTLKSEETNSNLLKLNVDVSSTSPDEISNDQTPVNKMKQPLRKTLLPLPNMSRIDKLKSLQNDKEISLVQKTCSSSRNSSLPIKSPNQNLSIISCETRENETSDEPDIICSYPSSIERKRKALEPERYKKVKLSPSFTLTSSPTPSLYEELSRSIWDLYYQHKQTKEIFNRKMALRYNLHKILLSKFPNCGLYVVGSSMTGLGAKNSDMDMCLMLTVQEIDQEGEAGFILHQVFNLFVCHDFILNMQIIMAKVPILRFKDAFSGIEIDLNINNAVGIRNTQLLNSYARLDKRFPPLVLLTKLWARFHDINDAKHHTLSSYSLVLMVIYYLQYGCKEPVLPCLQKLQPNKFHPNSDVRDLKLFEELPEFHSKNTENIGTLFMGFLNYFATEFNFENDVISVRLGCTIPKKIASTTFSPKNKKGHWKYICIEEPFDLTNTARSVFNEDKFFYILDVFSRSNILLRRTLNLNSILNGY